ncbi:hypothetical protein DMB44_05465 [Thermoplasma sp. Kam2015]|nr:hypothetical protein DMB44_05465 [Thermoplasma sp. Kam2015]
MAEDTEDADYAYEGKIMGADRYWLRLMLPDGNEHYFNIDRIIEFFFVGSESEKSVLEVKVKPGQSDAGVEE